MTVGYLRIPKYADVDSYSNEIKALRGYNVYVIEQASYAHELKNLMEICNTLAKETPSNGEFHFLYTWDLSTLGAPSKDTSRSNLVKLIDTILWMYDHKILVKFLNPAAANLTSIQWNMLAEYTRKIISEGKKLGAARAKATGQRLGRPRLSLSNGDIIRMWQVKDREGNRKFTVNDIALHCKVSKTTIKLRLRELKREGKI